jgi:hypothetical protein
MTQIVWFADSVGLNCTVVTPDFPGVMTHRYICRQIPSTP